VSKSKESLNNFQSKPNTGGRNKSNSEKPILVMDSNPNNNKYNTDSTQRLSSSGPTNSPNNHIASIETTFKPQIID